MELNLEGLAKIIPKGAKRIAVQIPEGLKMQAKEISGFFAKEGKTAIIFLDPCFGACDLKENEAKMLGAEMLVHFGHAPTGKHSKKTVFWPIATEFGEESVARKILEECKKRNWKKIGLGTTIQYIGGTKKVVKILEKSGIRAFLGKGSARISCNGQVLGCNYSAVHSVEKKADGFFFIGDGLFHGTGMGFSSKKNTVCINPKNLGTQDIEREKEAFFRKRAAMVGAAREANSFGIIVSTKGGQMQLEKALKAKQIIEGNGKAKNAEEKGKSAFLLAMDFVRPENFAGLGLDCLVCTACPRIAYDDSALYKIPLITFSELEIVFGKKRIEELEFEEI